MTSTSIYRDTFFDNLKFVLISLVIFGHSLELGDTTRFTTALYNTIYSFHMPLFVFVSGYFSKKQKDTKVFFRQLLTLMETLLCFQLAFTILSFLKGNHSLSFLYTPKWILWYLLSLMFWKTIIQIVPTRFLDLNNRVLVIFVSVIISLVGGFIPLGYEVSFQRTLTFLPFFMMVFFAKKEDYHRFLFPRTVAVFYLFAVMILLYIANRSFTSFLYGSNPYHDLTGLFARMVQFIAGILGGLSVMSIVAGTRFPQRCQQIGADTLFYYLYHAFLIYAISYIETLFVLSFSFMSVLFIFVGIMVVLNGMSKIQLLHDLITPITYIYDKTNLGSWRR